MPGIKGLRRVVYCIPARFPWGCTHHCVFISGTIGIAWQETRTPVGTGLHPSP